jgi:hypothetical protein
MKTNTRNYVIPGMAILLGALACANAQTTFTKVTTGPIVTDQGQFVRSSWADFNNDGYLDLVVCNWGGRTNVYYRNNGDGTFTKINQGDPVQEADYHVSPEAGDYDNDGFLDLVVSSGTGAPNLRRNLLLHGNGDGTFSRVSSGALVLQTGYFGVAAWADYNNDGFLDLFLTDSNGRANELWRNNGDGSFTKITSGPPTTDINGWAVCWADYDNDGFMDLFVTPGQYANTVDYLYHNNGDGTFQRVLTNAIVSSRWVGGSEAGTWGDYNNDGLLDLFVTGDNGSPDRLYRNDGGGAFTLITNVPMASRPAGSDSLACAWGDYDNDGWLDLLVTHHNANNSLFHNNGDGTFTQILAGAPVNDYGPGYSLAGWVDYDNDGFLDLFIGQNNSDTTSITNLLYHNDGNTNNWLEVKLIGRASNRSAIGAKVRINAVIGGQPLWQMREISNGGGRWVQPLTAHFGLGAATNVEVVRIEWPSGVVQTLTNVASRQILTVEEHQVGTTNSPNITTISRATDGSVNLSVSGDRGLLYVFEGSTNLLNWTWLGVRSNATGAVQFTDFGATNYASRFYRVFAP